MAVIGRRNHALAFNGVNDSIIIPQGRMTRLGQATTEGTKSPLPILGESAHGTKDGDLLSGEFYDTMTIEAWVIPDCGGVIVEKEGMFSLSIGNVDTPGPAVFEVLIDTPAGLETVRLATATDVTTRYEGTVYPPANLGGMHDSYNRFTGSDVGTSLNINHRPLIHVVASLNTTSAVLSINGEIMVRKEMKNKDFKIAQSDNHVYVGGKGGQFRGVMEALHIGALSDGSVTSSNPPLVNPSSLLLYRFEEPIAPIEGSYNFTTMSTNSGLTRLTISSADAITLATKLTGESKTSGDVDFTTSPYSSGNYKVIDRKNTTTHSVAHLPYNLLINPDVVNPNTKKPNQSPPERVRLHSITDIGGSPYLTVSSIHLEFDSSSYPANPLRPVLHTRTDNVDKHFVVVGADLLVDNDSGKPYQPPHLATQIIDRTGQMVIDESDWGQHGFVFSNRMSTTISDTDNPFAVTWPSGLDERYQIGHSGRHIANHVDGHEYLRMLPRATDEIVDQQIDGSSDIIEIIYDDTQRGIEKQVTINAEVDVFREQKAFEITDLVNSSTATAIFHNGLPDENKEIIAIGGAAFDYRPFMLKGPVPTIKSTVNTETRRYHARPSKISRVALLSVPGLAAYDMAPFIEVHYNAVDLTGESMSTTDQPLLMVEKTVPAGSTVVSGATTVYSLMYTAITSSGVDSTLYAPGGYVDVRTAGLALGGGLDKPHTLIGDTSEGYEVDDELDESLVPVNYNPMVITGTLVNNVAGYAANTTGAMTVDGEDATDYMEVGSVVYNSLGLKIGVITSMTSTSITMSAGTLVALVNNEAFYLADANAIPNITPQIVTASHTTTTSHDSVFHRMVVGDADSKNSSLTDKGLYSRREPTSVPASPSTGEFDKGGTASSTNIHEMFDVIDNAEVLGKAFPTTRLFIQPSDRRRVNQLTNLRSLLTDTDESNMVSLMYLMSRAKIRSVGESEGEQGSYVTVRCTSLSDALANRTVNFRGKGSPDSHIVKEIEPNAPVVTVTLGGPGQGAVDTKPTYDPSPLARLPFSTRRNCATLASEVNPNSRTLTVKPLNNLATDLASWGTYGFPKVGRVYLQDGSSALYDSKNGTTFTFTNATFGDGKFLLPDGTELETFYEWVVATNIHGGAVNATTATAVSVVLFNDKFFDESALAEDGTTVNDRMFQSMSDVQHDYQLGTQYASTRAMVEIPFFANQFFDDGAKGIHPGPDNSMKVHIDATHTAHTYNPSPIGRRPLDKSANDREAHSAFSFNKARNMHVPSTFVKGWTGTAASGKFNLYVENANIFPTVSYPVADSSYQNVDEVRRYRRVFLASGAWAFYIGKGADWLEIPDDSTWGYSDTFMEEVKTGVAVFMGGPPSAEELIPIGSDALVPSSDYEGRGEYYHDTASVKTQGGNVDYGLRQYVSAVEFKAGPESNPHAPRIKSKRARGTVKTLKSYLAIDDDGTTYIKQIVITMDDEEMALFPDDIHGEDMSTATFNTGDFLYEAETVESNGTIRKMHYYGKLSKDSDSNILNNDSLVFVYKSTTNASTTDSWVTNLVGNEIYLSRRTRRIMGNNGGMNASSSPANNELRAATYKPSGSEQWLITTNTPSLSDEVTIVNSNGRMIGSALQGLNLREGDTIYADSTGVIDKIGIVEHIEDYDGGSYKVTLTVDAAKTVVGQPLRLGINNAFAEDRDGWLNATWHHPYAPGGLRNGDTVWANMTMNNPYAVEGLFSKSRGVFNEAQVWTGFNGGVGALDSVNPRDSIPLENFLIGDTCLETAINYAQHVNKTVEENYKALGLTVADAPTVAYVDPYLSEDGHARVLLYDVAHDREFVAFQDLHMQVQTSADAVKIGWPRHVVHIDGDDAIDIAELTASTYGGGPSILTTQIDVANGFPSQNPYIRSTQQSKFIESAYAHDVANRLATTVLNPLSGSLPTSLPSNAAKLTSPGAYGKAHGHHVHMGYTLAGSVEDLSVGDSCLPRTQDASVLPLRAQRVHNLSRVRHSIENSFVTALVKTRLDAVGASFRDGSTTFDTPDGTRVIPAFLCLKGIRNSTLDLTGHEETRLQHLKQWTEMDFVRRLSIDAGEVGIRNGVVSVETATQEIVRIINQAAAPKAQVIVDGNTTGSAHDPIPWWDGDKAFSSRDRGSHMGYLRAHIGRPVQDLDGNLGHTVVIHSTVPGATGRNFCVWLDNSKGQSTYKPQFLIGHGGRWRNFWALPEEKEGENMHPAPMPLNKHGRPFAPITTLQQYVTPENSGEAVSSVADFINAGDDSNPVLRAISNSVGGGSQFNTVNEESFETEGSSSTFVQGLRTGKRATSRINFGGMVASGVPGFAPDAGDWGFGQKGSQQFRSKYGSIDDIAYTNHVPTDAITSDNVGSAPLYGLQFEDHRGGKHGIRFIYRKVGENYANENTTLPDTIDNEVCVFFDDNDVAQGGFTIGKHMNGSGDASGRLDKSGGTGSAVSITDQIYCGNKWRGVNAPSIAVNCTISKAADATSLTVGLERPFQNGGTCDHHDILGYLGFPLKDGVIQITDSQDGKGGMTFSYTHRTQSNKGGTHTFFGIKSSQNGDIFAGPYLISPLLNWTTIMTDELMAAVTAAAINASSSQINSPNGLSFDCTEMYATDGRTFGEWGVTKDAIKIRAHDSEKDIKGLSQFFSASLHRDLGIQAAHLEFGEVEKTENASTGWAFGTTRIGEVLDSVLEENRNVDCGYIPNTILQIQSMSRGPNSNTATPVLVDSFNNPVNITKWKKGLTGESYTSVSGDHILPCINNPIAVYATQGDHDNWNGTDKTLPLGHEMWNFLIPAGEEGNVDRVPSFGEKRTIYMSEKRSIVVEGLNPGASSLVTNKTTLVWYDEGKSDDWPVTEPQNSVANYENVVFSHYGDKRAREFDGLRSLGSVLSEPIVYFRGGKSSSDHSVPLFFGGGFSGVTLDINDGTMNDYSSFYTHPYANGPTGTAGIQNANEISTSFALLDCNAMFAFFPGTPFCNQHRGSITPPAFNKDSVLSPDLAHGDGVIHGSHPNNVPYTAGVAVQKPSPLILRFAHPTARYEDHRGGTDSKTTYMIFGPGQAFPFNQEVADDDGQSRWNAKQPHTGKVVVVGNTWAKVPSRYATPFLPNHIDNNDGNFMPLDSTYQLARGRFHWRTVMNWEPPQGKPNIGKLSQRPEHGRMYGQNFTSTTPTSGIDTDLDTAHPMRHCSMLGFSVAMAADMVFHMDGGYHPGGHWMDNQISFNPSHPKSDTILTGWGPTTQIHPSAFRVAGPISTKVLAYAATEGDLIAADTDKEYIIVDATRCQNGEELATVLGAAVNAFPGVGALKAMGGTHMPSMGNAMRQDRYGWIETDYVNNSITHIDSKPKNNHISVTITNKTTNNATNRAYLEQIPACGWLRADATIESGNAAFAPYFAREIHDDSGLEVKFYLAPNRITNSLKFESRDTWYTNAGTVEYPTFASGTKIHVWSKAGVHRFNNEASTTRDHMCQVHFSGLVDAIDRTRPIGSVGWAGERYSYLNSLKVGTEGYAAGLSAWHPMLGFSPYGKASSAMNVLGHSPLIAPMPRSPESLPPIDGLGSNLMSHMNSPWTAFNMESHTLSYQTSQVNKGTDANAPYTLHSKPPIYVDNSIPEALTHPQGVFGRAFVVVSYECESALIGKYDRDGITALGDWLQVKGAAVDSISNPITFAGTTRWDERFHGEDRFIAPANAGPNVEALVHKVATIPSINFTSDHSADGSPFNAEYNLHASNLADSYLENAVPSLNKTGDLLFDLDHSIGSYHLESDDAERNVAADFYVGEDYTQVYDLTEFDVNQSDDFWAGDINAFAMHSRAPSKNFSVENIVWKRMDGGNLSLPAINARGLGAVPWMTRVEGGVGYTTGEKIFGNVRFTFETTNSAMLPVLQAQELSHPQLASKHPYEVGNILEIPNEEMQFEEITVVDDSGQEHILEGGSPLGTIIRGFKRITDRGVQGSAPSLANSGVAPNLKIQLPDPDTIPGNIVVRSGFDRLQAYQNETMGSGGMIHPDLSEAHIGNLFDNSVSGPRKGPTYEDHNWEHIDPLTKDSTVSGWGETTGNAPLRTSYEQHDRTLYFHVTKMGHSHTHRYPTVYTHAAGLVTNVLTASSWDSATSILTTNTVDRDVYAAGTDATATITITAFTELNAGDKVNLVATDGTNYDFSQGNQSSVNGTFEATTSNDVTATNLMNVINTSSGPSGTRFTATVNGAVVTVTQAVKGVDGNTTVTLTDSGTAGMTKTDFIDGGRHRFGSKEVKDGRGFIRIYNPSTEESVVASYTGISGQTFTGIVGDVDFTDFMAGQTVTDLKVVPSYYIPAGSNRFFAARRLRDHAEVSGNSPDMSKTQYFPTNWNANSSSQVLAHTIYSKPVMTPMPLPRMGHHFVTPTMPMLPGHWAHPAYQGLYRKHMAENASLRGYADRNRFLTYTTNTSVKSDISSSVTDYLYPLDPEIAFGSLNAAPSGPSDIHGGAFTLMFETKIRYDGYGILASVGIAGTVNKVGGHTILLEAGGNYTQDKHFPDPAEVGAYQIIIQPNTYTTQLVGHHYYGSANSLTGQQVNTVIGIKNANSTTGALGLVLAEATQADVRGCEIFINEVMLDQNPDFGEQLANIAPLALYNQFGIAGTESPAFTRRAFGYSPSLFSNSTPGYTVNIPWWSIVHKNGPDSNATGFRHLAHHRLDNYYELSRSTLGSIGVQLTIAGYPSIYPDIYSHILQNTSLNPRCTFVEKSGTTIEVDNATLFPETPYYGQLLEYTDADGIRQTTSYTRREGLQAGTLNENYKFTDVSSSNNPFWTKLTVVGTEIRLTRAYDMLPAGDILTNEKKSIFTHILPQVLTGTRDTTSLHIPDAYLCLWNPNLGRPHTFYSDSSRTWLNLTGDRAVDKKPYNSMPEHFETIHYQDSIHAMSLGPFDLRIKTPSKASKDGTLIVASSVQSTAGQDVSDNWIMYSKFWPCGSRGGPLVSRLEAYTQSSVSWDIPRKYASDDLYEWEDEDGLAADYALASSGVTLSSALGANETRRYPYGYRIAVRQACNRPTWGLLPARAKLEDDNTTDTGYTVGYQAGPLVQSETRAWTYSGGSSLSSPSYPTTYVGTMERQTNFAGMLNVDKPEWQVRYSEGRRMTRPFGAPVRTLRNNSNQEKDWWGDIAGKSITSVSEAAQYYLVDWWGNERGEDVRRAPVRGFGIRPAWDCGDVYEYDRTNSRTPHARIWNNGKPIFEVSDVIDSSNGALECPPPRFCGSNNERNNSLSGANAIMVDAFAPTHAMRIGDMGNGRGVRYPIQFNEDILTELSEPVHTTGVVLSHNTAEPLFGNGLLRPRNAVLQADEVPRGISARLGVAENGLLKPDAVVSDRVEEISGVSPHKDAISRTSPRIGLDAHTKESIEKDHIAVNTEAHSLHTDRNVGQRTVLLGAHTGGSQTLTNCDLTGLDFSVQPVGSVLKFSHTSNMSSLGGTYIMESKSYTNFFDDTTWGVHQLAGSTKTTNPYQTTTYNRTNVQNNQKDKSVKFMVRAIRLLDKSHIEMFRPALATASNTPQRPNTGYAINYFGATVGGKYGMYIYEVANGRVTSSNFPRSTKPDGNGPYVPVYYIDSANNIAIPTSKGPNIPGTEVSGFDKTTLASTVSRLVMSENTLQHYRSDAPRRRQEKDVDEKTKRMDFSVIPRFSQALHSKGHKGDVNFNISDHSGDAS